MKNGPAPLCRLAHPDPARYLLEGGWRCWIFVTNNHATPEAQLEWEHRQQATVETGMGELKSNFELHTFKKVRVMANRAGPLIVCLGHNLCAWSRHLGALDGGRHERRL